MPQKIKRILPVILILAVLGATIFYLSRQSQAKNGPLAASGAVEVIEVVVAIQVGGQISEVLVSEGQAVQSGEVLIRFEDELLQAQYQQTEAALSQAKTNYQLIVAQPLSEQRQVAIANAQLELLSAEKALQDLIDNADLARAQAQQNIETGENALEDLRDPDLQQALALEAIAIAKKMVDENTKRVRNLTSTASQSDIDAAAANLTLLKDVLDKANEDYKPYANKPEDNLTRANYLTKQAEAQQKYDAAVRWYNGVSGIGDPVDIAIAQADLATAEAQLEQAQREYERVKDGPSLADIAVLKAQIRVAQREFAALKDGPDPNDLALAQARVDRAKAQLALAQANTIQEQLEVSQAQVESAQAALTVIQTQLDKLTLTAPVAGVVLFRAVEPGETVKPGTNALTIGLLDELTLTVYIPEDRYGEIRLGKTVRVEVDSFPGEIFSATVSRIADQAEYTPRNVQTEEGRRATVFAVELAVNDPGGKLKPGMPADVVFGDQ